MQEKQDLQRSLQAMTVERDTALSSRLGRCTAAAAQHVPLAAGLGESWESLHTDTAGEEHGQDTVAQVIFMQLSARLHNFVHDAAICPVVLTSASPVHLV